MAHGVQHTSRTQQVQDDCTGREPHDTRQAARVCLSSRGGNPVKVGTTDDTTWVRQVKPVRSTSESRSGSRSRARYQRRRRSRRLACLGCRSTGEPLRSSRRSTGTGERAPSLAPLLGLRALGWLGGLSPGTSLPIDTLEALAYGLDESFRRCESGEFGRLGGPHALHFSTMHATGIEPATSDFITVCALPIELRVRVGLHGEAPVDEGADALVVAERPCSPEVSMLGRGVRGPAPGADPALGQSTLEPRALTLDTRRAAWFVGRDLQLGPALRTRRGVELGWREPNDDARLSTVSTGRFVSDLHFSSSAALRNIFTKSGGASSLSPSSRAPSRFSSSSRLEAISALTSVSTRTGSFALEQMTDRFTSL
jgi:hypothetical protein